MADNQEIQQYYEGAVEPVFRSIFGTNLHLAMFEGDESQDEAMQRTKEFLLARLPAVSTEAIIFDLGSGYGDTARYLAQQLDCRVVGLNLVHVQNVTSLSLSVQADLAAKTFALEADFAQIPFLDGCAGIVWSQESMLHASDRHQVVVEAARMLQPGGVFLFTDLLQTGPMTAEEARLIQERVKIDPLENFAAYRDYIKAAGLELVEEVDLSHYVADYYENRAQKIEENREMLLQAGLPDLVDYTARAMRQWSTAAAEGKLGWGMFLCRKP